MGVPFWQEDTNAWDRVEIAGFEFDETIVDVDGDFGSDFDVKKSPGADGAPATNKGYEPCKPKLVWMLYKREHYDDYELLLKKVQPRPGKQQGPEWVEVIHPQLQLVGKSKFRIAKIHMLKKVGPQQMQAQFDLLEWFAAPKPIPKPVPPKPPKPPFTDNPNPPPNEGQIIHPAIDFQPRPLDFK